jgi:hypothetical protein
VFELDLVDLEETLGSPKGTVRISAASSTV